MTHDYEVVWNGSIQRQADSDDVSVVISQPRLSCRVQVLALLRERPELTMPEMSQALGVAQSQINSVLYSLRGAGAVKHGRRETISKHGRICRSYILVDQ